MKKIQSVKMNVIMNTILTMSGMIFQIISFPYASRVLGADSMGKSAFAISLVSYFLLFSQLGIPTYGVVACARVREDKEELTKTVHELLCINFIMSIFSYVIFVILLFGVPRLSEDRFLYLAASATVFMNMVGMEWMYRGLEQYSYITIRSVVFKFLALAMMILCVNSKTDYIIYTFIIVLATSGSQIFNLFYARKFVSFRLLKKYDIGRHMKSVLVFFSMSCATTIYTHLDTVMLGFLKSDEIVGYYNAAVKIKTFLVAIVTSVGAVLLPRASYYIKNNQYEKFELLSGKALRFIFVAASSTAVFFLIFAKETVLILSGSGFMEAVLPMKIIMPTVLFIGITNILGIQMLVPMGLEKVVLKSEIAGALTNLLFNTVLIPKFAAVGAAIGTLLAEAVVLLVQSFYLRGEVKTAFKKFHMYSFCVVLVIGGLCCRVLLEVVNQPIIVMVIGASIFFGILFFWYVKSKELHEFLNG